MDTPKTTDPENPSGCKFCAASALRRSRFRSSDLSHLLLLLWPVRCLACGKRQYASPAIARRAISSHAPHAPELLAKESWQHFTAPPSSHNESDR